MKRIFILLIFLVILTGSVSAAQTADVGGYKFGIPDDYSQDYTLDIENQKTYTNFMDCHANAKTFSKYFESITVTVTSPDDGDFPDELAGFYGGQETTINGVKGYVSLDGHDYLFSYIKDGNWIVVKSWDVNSFEDIVVG